MKDDNFCVINEFFKHMLAIFKSYFGNIYYPIQKKKRSPLYFLMIFKKGGG
jgi:hypothetical protein